MHGPPTAHPVQQNERPLRTVARPTISISQVAQASGLESASDVMFRAYRGPPAVLVNVGECPVNVGRGHPAVPARDGIPSIHGTFTAIRLVVQLGCVRSAQASQKRCRETSLSVDDDRRSDEPLVSMDFKGDSRSSVIDASMTTVVGGTLVKVIAWYDNEWAFSCRLADIIGLVASRLPVATPA
ncbi:MAG TPA: hypothetical protein VGK63_12640 [Candidatus Limnocylindrales bacterium]